MPRNRVFGDAPGYKSMSMAPVFGEVAYEIIIQTDGKGLMRTRMTKYPVGQPPTQLQMLGMLLDCLNGQYQGMIQSASMLIDPNNGKAVAPNGGQEKENHHDSGGNTPGGNTGD